MPTDDADLETSYTTQDETDVATKDNIRVEQSADGEYAIHQFKDYIGAATSINLECELQTNIPPSMSTVYLQIYNYNTPGWENVDSDNSSNPDQDFILEGDIPDTTNYVNNSIVACRVYQQDI